MPGSNANPVSRFIPPRTPLVAAGTLERFSRDAAEPDYFRCIIDGRAFYAHADRFAEPARLDALRVGEQVVAGVHSLRDGLYYLHWLHSEGTGLVEPARGQRSYRADLVVFLMGLVAMFAGGAVILVRYLGGKTMADMSFWIVAAGAVLCFLGHKAVGRLSEAAAGFTRLYRTLERELALFRAKGFAAEGAARASDLPKGTMRIEQAMLGQFADSARLETGQATGIEVEKIRRHRTKRTQLYYYNIYSFVVNGAPVRWLFKMPKERDWLFHPVFHSTFPEFLAEDDTVTALVPNTADWRASDIPFPNLNPAPGDAAALSVAEDGRLYPPERAGGTIRMWHKKAFALLLVFWSMVIIGMAQEIVPGAQPVLSLNTLALVGVIAGLVLFDVVLATELIELHRRPRGYLPEAVQALVDFAIETDGFSHPPPYAARVTEARSRWTIRICHGATFVLVVALVLLVMYR